MTIQDFRYIAGGFDEAGWPYGGWKDETLGLPSLDEDAASLVITSPPWPDKPFDNPNIVHDCNQHRRRHWSFWNEEDNHNFAVYRAWRQVLYREIRRVLRPTGSFWLHSRPHYREEERRCMVPFWHIEDVENAGFTLKEVIIWNRGASFDFLYRFNHPRNHVETFTEKVWDVDKDGPLRIEFSPALLRTIIHHEVNTMDGRVWGDEPFLILDPFAGSGIMGLVAAEMDLDWIGWEINPNFVDNWHTWREVRA